MDIYILIYLYNKTIPDTNNITQINELGINKTYTYDDLYRLTKAIFTPTGGNSTTYNYSYNAIGNIINGNGLNYIYSGNDKKNPHAVTKIGSNNYGYDNNGNLNSAPNISIVNNWQNQPKSITLNGTTTINMFYDESGKRFIYKTPTTTEIQVDQNYIVRNSIPEISIKLGNIPIGTIKNGNIYKTISDHLDTPLKQIDFSDTIVEDVSYDPFGKVLSQNGSLNTKRGYTGHEEDADTGFVYAQARYYNPGSLRFNQQDPSHIYLGSKNFESLIGTKRSQILPDPQQLNSYSYVRNNPINGVDPTGKSFLGDLFTVQTVYAPGMHESFTQSLTDSLYSVNYSPDVRTPLSTFTRNTLQDSMIESNQSSVLVTSTNRTPEEQAKIMYNNTAQTGVEVQLNLYGSEGDKVINIYPDLKGMIHKTSELAQKGVFAHVQDPSVKNVFDIDPSSVSKANQNAFMNAIYNNSNVSKFLTPYTNPKDTSFHLEVKQPKTKLKP